MAISSPLDITWSHAYWVEGPEFLALYGGSPGAAAATSRVGMVAVQAATGIPDGTRIDTWPDEVGTLDATQGTSTNEPTYHTAAASLNGKPYIDFPDSDQVGAPDNAVGLRTASFTGVNQPNEIVVIARQTATPTIGGHFFWGLTGASQSHMISSKDADQWRAYDGSQNADTGTILDTNAHVFDAIFDYPTIVDLRIDGTSQATFVPAFQHSLDRFSIGMDGIGGNIYPYIVFVGVKLGAKLSAGDRSDLVSWSSGYYGTP